MERRLRHLVAIGAGYVLAHSITQYVSSMRMAISDAAQALTDIQTDQFLAEAVAVANSATTEPPEVTAPSVDESGPCVCGSTEHASDYVISVDTPALLDNGPTGFMRCLATFAFVTSTPHSIHMRLAAMAHYGPETETWEFGRDLLDTALSADGKLIGEGDVQAQLDTERDHLNIYLRDGTYQSVHRLEVFAAPVRALLVRSFELVPHGDEDEGDHHGDMDEGIARLLDGTWGSDD